MGAYQYHALKPSGRRCKGIIEADSARHARQQLRAQHLFPTQVYALKQISTIKKTATSLFASELALLTRQLATLLSAGIPVEEALHGVSQQTTKPKIRQLLIGVRSKVLEGYSLAHALAAYPYAFPALYRTTISAGEQTGHLDEVLEKLATYIEEQQQTRQKIKQALIYPAVMIIVSTTIISFLLAFVVPKIIEVFKESHQSLPEMTRALIFISFCVKQHGLTFVGFIVFLGILFKKSLKYQKITILWERFLLKIPFISYLLKTINVSRYTHTFAILFAAGVSVLETMHVSASLINNGIMRRAFDDATIRVREGMNISQALNETGFLKPMAQHLISSGEKSGQLVAMLERTAHHLDVEVKRQVDTVLTLLEPLIILAMGVVVLFIVLATLLPIFTMEQLVT